jgi:hypothetical protein
VTAPLPTSGRWTERYPLAKLSFAADLSAAVAAIAIATLIRLLVNRQLPPGFPFLTYFPVVLLVAFTLACEPAGLPRSLAGWRVGTGS